MQEFLRRDRNSPQMTALYLGVVVLPLVVLVWNLGPGGVRRRALRRRQLTAAGFVPAVAETRTHRLRQMPATFLAAFRSAWSAATHGGDPAAPVPQAFALPPDLPRSPSTPGWVPAQGYAARPRPLADAAGVRSTAA